MQTKVRRRQALESAKLSAVDGLLVSSPTDVRWLTGFTGSSGAVALLDGKAALFTDGRYTTQARAEASGLRVVIGKGSPSLLAAQWLADAGVQRCGFDASTTTVAGLAALRESVRAVLPGKLRRTFFQPVTGVVAKLREIKDPEEIAAMRAVAGLGCRVFNETLEHLRAAGTEAGFALALELAAKRGGAEAMSFEAIVAAGPRSALPHGRASAAKLPRRGMLVIDFGVLLNGHCSDMTRTVCLGKATAREHDVYHSVLEAQQAAVAAVRPGVSCGEVDEAARSVLRRARLDKWFTHSTGHGVGLDIHESPRLAAEQTQPLEVGMVVTVEPGVYLPGEFGVRIEDTVVVTERGCEVITARSPKQWIEGL